MYISSYGTTIDPITHTVANHASFILNELFSDISLQLHPTEPVAEIFEDGYSIVRVIEGCNSASIFILFVSFIVAFKGKLFDYVWFIPAAGVVLHLANTSRIALLGYVYYHYNDLTTSFHDYIFPAIIYGSVLLLWMFWVKFVSDAKFQ